VTDPEAIRTAVGADASLTALVGDRVWPLILPEHPTLPAITYALVSQPTEVTQEGVQYRSPKWRLRLWSLDYDDLIPMALRLAAIFGDQARTPFPSSRIEYPASAAEEHEPDTHFYTRAVDVVVGLAPAGATAQ
jgi:hypothetical protein